MARALRGLRGRSAVVALTLASLMAVNVTAGLHDLGDDPYCELAVGGGSPGPDRIAPADGPARHAEHCVVCHAVQTVRAAQTVVRYVAPTLDTRLLATAPVSVITSVLSSSQPARAPPVA